MVEAARPEGACAAGPAAAARIAGARAGPCCMVLRLRQAFVSGPIVTISPAGLRDIRVAREVSPWRVITQLSIWGTQGQHFVVVALAPGDERRLTLTRTARWTRAANRRLGADGPIVLPHGLQTDLDTLFATLDAHIARHR